MSKLENVLEVWDNGATCPEFGEVKKLYQHPVQWVDDFCRKTGAIKPVATRWTFDGQTYESSYRPVPLYQSNCLVEFHNDASELVVLNPNGTIRHKVRPVWNLLKVEITPELKRHFPHLAFSPTQRKLGYYPTSVSEAGPGKFSAICDDGIGDTDCLYDAESGNLLRFRRTRF
jgi:hypothetical protein